MIPTLSRHWPTANASGFGRSLRLDAYVSAERFIRFILCSPSASHSDTSYGATTFVTGLAVTTSPARLVGVVYGPVAAVRRDSARRRPARSYWWSPSLRTKRGVACVAFVFLVQVINLCLCGSGAATSRACCAGAASKANGSTSAGPASPLESHSRDCCQRMTARTVAPLSPRDSLPAPHLFAVSYTASLTAPTNQIAALGSATTAVGKIPSPPRSPILRI